MVRCALLALLLCAGCAEAPAPVAPYPTTAFHHTGAWQQFCEQAWNVPHASSLVAARGADGWELVAMYNGALCYKRPIEPRPSFPGTQANPATPGSYVPVVRDPGF